MLPTPTHSRLFQRLGLGIWLLAGLLLPLPLFGAFGVTSGGGSYTVDTGAGLVFKVDQSNGDVTSIRFNGVEYQATDKNSHIASGLGSATVTAATLGSYIRLACTTSPSNTVAANLTHYLMVRSNHNVIYMATYAAAEPAVGELRWITRLRADRLSTGPVPSDNRGNIGAIESSDCFGMPDGTTRSKYYGDNATHGKDRAMDLSYCGATGIGVGVWMVYDRLRESASGGPFFRDIQNQCGTDQEIYNYMNSGHNQTEPWRVGVLHGPYALVFTGGGPPELPIDYSWMETAGLDLAGWVSAANRGAVTGSVSRIPAGFPRAAGFANANAQYWATVAADGSYATPLMKPGTYTATLYKGELGVATSSVTVAAGVTNTSNLVSAELNPAYIFKLGEWDGTPGGFLNADDIVMMHPQDVRNNSWGPVTYVVETNSPGDFPAIQFRGVNSPTTIRFNLTPQQAAVGHTVRIGLTCAYNGGRPKITVNSWVSANPAPSSQPSSRSFTIGTYRGNNALFTYSVPASAFVAGQNTLLINPISGSSDLGPWLSAGWVYDCVELDGTPTLPAAPTQLTATPGYGLVALAWNPSPSAVRYEVKRANSGAGPYTVLETNVALAHYTDAAPARSATNYYVVSALNAAGESADSAPAGAAPFDVVIGTFARVGNNAALSGSGGAPNATFCVLASLNINLPPAQWTRIATNRFDASGSFLVDLGPVTNQAQRFYRLTMP